MKKSLLCLVMVTMVSHGISQNWNRLIMLSQDADYLTNNFQYEEAAETYLLMLKELPGSSAIRFMLGDCYLRANGKIDEAILYLKEASSNVSLESDGRSLRNESAPVEALLLLGTAYQRNNQFEEARNCYGKFRDILPPGDERRLIADQHLARLDNAMVMMNQPVSVRMTNLGKPVNSEKSNIRAVLSGDGNTLAYTNLTNDGFDVFISRKEKTGWGKPENITWQLRRSYLMTSSLSWDGTELYLVYYFPGRSDIYHSVFDGSSWKRAAKLKSPVNSRANETHASISADGGTLYFTSNRDGGYGGLDIYRAGLDAKGRWSNVENLGEQINTPFNEETPFIASDGKTLFFSSEGHSGMGGYDIFYVDTENPDRVHNLGYPLNNSFDNLFYFPVGEGREGYLSFYTREGVGQKDIFLVTLPDDFFQASSPRQKPEEPLAGVKADEEMHEADLKDDTGILSEEGHPADENQLADLLPEAILPDDAAIVPMEFPGDDLLPEFVASSELPSPAVSSELPVLVASAELPDESKVAAEKPGPVRKVRHEIPEPAKIILPGKKETGKTSSGVTYSVQFLAFSRYGDLSMIGQTGENAVAHFCGDGITRFLSGYHNTYEETLQVLATYYDYGYGDAFIRVNPFTAGYTIQIFAARNPDAFRQLYGLHDILSKKGSDGIYRYSWGIFSSQEEAMSYLEQIRASGFSDAFIRKM
jgi:hypothetical protein